MCGLVGGYGQPSAAAVDALKHRGPDAHDAKVVGPWWLGHTRLSVQDPNPRSDQPMRRGETTLVYNGELWNAAELRDALERCGRTFDTTGDTEVVCTALDEWGAGALALFEGMFALAWVGEDGALRLARDRFGEVPMHCGFANGAFVFASEMKALRVAGARGPLRWVEPGELVTCDSGTAVRVERWYEPSALPSSASPAEARHHVVGLLRNAVAERCVADVPVCTLLSGGIDSAIVARLLVDAYPGMTAYLAVMDERSKDVRCAREVAEACGMRLVEVRVPPPTSDDLASVVQAIEMPHKAQVEIGWPCVLLAERMRVDGFKVTFSGEGSDELWASYGFAHHGVQKVGWHRYRKELFLEQHRKNFPRANKVFMARGVECRLPFLNRQLVEAALGWTQEVVQRKGKPKAILQDAFRGILPDSVVDRQKLAFQDGLGMKDAAARAVADPRRFYAAEFSRI